MQAKMMGMFEQATSKGSGRNVSVGTLMLHGSKQKIGHERKLTIMRMLGRATSRFMQTIGGARGMEKMMQMLVQTTQQLMTKIRGRNPLGKIGGKSGT